MDYNEYEDYMRSVLGYQTGNIYTNGYGQNNNDYYYNEPSMLYDVNRQNNEDLNEFYPEIYKLIYPMVCKACNQNMNKQITKELIDSITEEIYLNFESDDRQNSSNVRSQPPLKNGDVRNPNAKDPEYRGETRHNNFLLRDLIRILVLREFGRPIRPGFPGGRPPIVPPPRPGRPPMRPWR